MSTITEIVTFQSSEGIIKEDFIRIVDELENNYHSKQPGFIDTELLYDEKKFEWVMIQHWDSPENQKSASVKMFKSSEAEAFVKSVIPNTVKMRTLTQLQTW